MTEANVRFLDRPGCQIAYRTQGDGPPLLLFHATLSSSRELGVLAKRLAAGASVTGVDRRASGESQLPPDVAAAPIDVAVHVGDAAALIEHLGGGPVKLVGHSYGGCLALELAARRPELVERVWVYEPPYAQAGPADVRERLAQVGAGTLEANERSGPEAAAEVFLAGVAGSDTVAGLSDGARARIRSQGAAAVAEATLQGLDPDGLGRITCPVVIATGADSADVYAVIADALAERIPGASHRRIAGADHMAPITRPGLIATSIIDGPAGPAEA